MRRSARILISFTILGSLGAGCASSTKSSNGSSGGGNAGGVDPRLQQLVEAGSCLPPRVRKGRQLPFMSVVAPGEGIALGGTVVTITGDGFVKGATVQIGDAPCVDVKVTDPTTLTCITTNQKAGMAEALIMNPDRRCSVLGHAFRYLSNVLISPRNKVVAVTNKFRFSASEGKPPYTYQLISGGGSVDATTGEYTAGETPGNAVVRVADAVNTVSDSIVTINPPLQVVPTDSQGIGGYKFDVVGGAPPVSYSMEQGEEAGEDQNENVKRQGTMIKVVDAMGNTAHIRLDLTRVPPLVIHPVLTQVVPGDRVSFVASGGKPPYTFSVEGGRGQISSTVGIYTAPNEPGTETVRVTDSSGHSQSSQVTITAEAFGVSRLALGYGHTCALTQNTVKCWGDNHHGQLGTGNLVDSRKPASVVGIGRDALSVVAGHSHTCALTAGGTIRCWGDNRYGQLGDGSGISSSQPNPVAGLASGVQMAAAGQYHTCAVVRGGVYCWGSNRRGQLGNGSLRASNTPVAVKGLTDGVISVATGAAHTCALTRDGGVKCWGYNYSGQLGDATVQDRLEATDVPGLEHGVKAIYAGGYHTCALVEGGKLKCWGNNGLGQLGNNTTKTMLIPTEVEGLEGEIRYASAGYFHTCAWTGTAAKCWGYNRDGQIGDNTRDQRRMTPATVEGLTDVVGLAAGVNHSCALVAGGIRCWGSNEHGQFGNHSIVSSAIPIPPESLQ